MSSVGIERVRAELALARHHARLVFGLRAVLYWLVLGVFLYFALTSFVYETEGVVGPNLYVAVFVIPFSVLLILWTSELTLIDRASGTSDLLLAEPRPEWILLRRFALVFACVLLAQGLVAVGLALGGEGTAVLLAMLASLPTLLLMAALAYCAAALTGEFFSAAGLSLLLLGLTASPLAALPSPERSMLAFWSIVVGTRVMELFTAVLLAYYGTRMLLRPAEVR